MNRVKGMIGRLSVTNHDVSIPRHRVDEHLRGGKSGRIDPRLVCLLRPRSIEAESYSRLRFALESLRQPEHGLVVGVTSPGTGDGKTVTAINLAGALAQDTSARVLLVDLDLRGHGSSVRDYIELQTLSGPGAADWISRADLDREGVIRYLPGFNLHLMSAGAEADLPYELLKSRRLDEFFDKARHWFDFVIVDTPQVVLLPDTELISRVVDGYLIVVKADHTSKKALEETLNLMTEDKVLGLVFNGYQESQQLPARI